MATPPMRGSPNGGNGMEPLRDLQDLQQQLNRLSSTLFGGPWNMLLDIHDSKDRLIIRAELPGVRPEEIDLTIQDNILTIRAERQRETEVKDENWYRQEIAYGVFERQVELPAGVNTENLQAGYKNGILEVSIPKRENAKPRQIRVIGQDPQGQEGFRKDNEKNA